jgi:C4-dicarboxylate-specific signal transduction histidine kinase
VDLASLLEELRIVVESTLAEQGIHIDWKIDSDLPPVWADRQSLMQVFLNLTRNSERAMSDCVRRELSIRAFAGERRVSVRISDTGCGVAHPDRLFRPFQQQAHATGLGLYLSRAFMRSFRGDLRYEPEADGSSFVVELSPAPNACGHTDKAHAGNTGDKLGDRYEADPNSARGRSQFVPREPEPIARS